MIQLSNIQKSFDGKEVLKGITTSFEQGKINLVIGASGSGKSVLMKSMVGLIEIDNGRIDYDGRFFNEMDDRDRREVRRDIGMLFQGTALFDSLTVEENVGFPLKMFTSMSPTEIKDRVNFCLNRVNLGDINDRFPAEISGGMKKRVGIARAISLDIKYLFCDEPNSGLDPVTSRLIDDLLLEITQEYEITTVINTHDMKTVFDIGDHVLFIYEGNMWWQGHKSQVRETDNTELKKFIDASYIG